MMIDMRSIGENKERKVVMVMMRGRKGMKVTIGERGTEGANRLSWKALKMTKTTTVIMIIQQKLTPQR